MSTSISEESDLSPTIERSQRTVIALLRAVANEKSVPLPKFEADVDRLATEARRLASNKFLDLIFSEGFMVSPDAMEQLGDEVQDPIDSFLELLEVPLRELWLKRNTEPEKVRWASHFVDYVEEALWPAFKALQDKCLQSHERRQAFCDRRVTKRAG